MCLCDCVCMTVCLSDSVSACSAFPILVFLSPPIDGFILIDSVQAISLMTSNQECVNDIAASDVLVYLLLALHTLPAGQLPPDC